MIDVNRLRNGTAFTVDGQPYLVVKYEFSKMGRGSGNIKVRCKNLKTGAVVNKTFTTGNKVEEIQLKKKKLQYLYSDAKQSVFMDPKSFEQLEIDNRLIEKQKQYFQNGMEVELLFWQDDVLAVELPAKLIFQIKETGPGEKGNSATNIFKPAVLTNGLTVKVPLFINAGDKVKIDTRTGEYVERV
jgi:elongation factor P